MEMEKKAEYASKEKANYDRIKKQGMSDQGIVNLDQLAAAGKKAYRKVKSKVKSMME
jgi:Tfp pilus assembly PilM family ATPase